ncbi:MAG: hypothetical protein WAX66_01965 [Patescibacteria group bacterium]|jgi:NAD-dependent dihydropyrimidine dehydrogenase PreA subunit
MAKILKPTQEDKCNGCELCLLEAQRQLKKVGLEESLIRIFRKKNDENQEIEMQVEIDPRISMLHVEKISKICPKNVFEVTDDENTEGKKEE